jgi:hypothetical protein
MMLMTTRSGRFSEGARFFESLEARQLLSVTPKLVEVPISSAAKAADPKLSNYRTFDLPVTLDKGERWTTGDLLANLSKGSFSNVSGSLNGNNFLQPNLWNISSRAMLQADTGVSASGFERPIILGQYSPAKAGSGTFSSTQTNVSWGSLTDPGTGTFTIARLTVSKDATGTIAGQVASTFTPAFQPKKFQFNIGGGSVANNPHISGSVFNDSDGDGKRDSGEKGIANWKIYLDKNNNGHLDKGEKYRYTDSNGDYSFDPLTAGTYYIRQTTPTGWRRTTPGKSSYVSAIKSGVNGTGKNFGNTTHALLSGTVFNDKNSNGKKNSGEGGLQSFMVWIDKDKDGKLDSGEKIAGSDKNGYWVFKTLDKGTWTVRIQSKSGYKATSSTSFSIKVASGASYTGRLFAEHKTA